MLRGTTEILAPVGGKEQLIAAVRSGADAVYLGGKGFNARRNAENFGEFDLSDAVSYCHARGVRVHVTVNTLVLDSEREALIAEARHIADSGADAVIVQDLSVLKLFREACPSLELHASTQAVVHNVDSAKMLQDLGCKRVVLAREMSLREIEKVAANVDVELEAFIHGALCTCVSGACYLSSMLGGRSGNRGLCAQPCRLNFTCKSVPYALSLKDASLIPHLKDMIEAGVTSFKIEGRMKRPEYVAATVTACRQALDGEKYDMNSLRKVFSRSGFTDGYILGRRGPEMQGTRTKEDNDPSVFGAMRSLYRAERQSVPVKMHATMLTGRNAELQASCGEDKVIVTGDIPSALEGRAFSRESVIGSLSKSGGTPFRITGVTLDSDEQCSLPSSGLNALRRQALEELLDRRSQPQPKPFNAPEVLKIDRHIPGDAPLLRGRFEAASQIPDTNAFTMISLPVEEIARHPEVIRKYGALLTGELPAVLFPENEERIDALTAELKTKGLESVTADNIYGIGLAKRLGLAVHGGIGLNITNTDALNEYARLGLADATVSFEIQQQTIRALGGELPRGAIGYGYLPLMRLRRCPNKGKNGCGQCTGHPVMTDRYDTEFPLLCHEKCYTTLLNSVPLWTADKPLTGVDFLTLYFTTENMQEAASVTSLFSEKRPLGSPHTYGLYGRTLL